MDDTKKVAPGVLAEVLAGDVLWDLHDLYSGATDPRFGADLSGVAAAAERVEAEYKGRIAELDAHQLATCVAELERLDALLGRLATYTFLNFITRTADAGASALVQKVEELSSRLGVKTVFFQLEWNLVAEERAAALLGDPALAKYRHYLAALRKFAPHQLPAAQEELLQELGPVGRAAWLMLFEKIMGRAKFGVQGRSEEEVLSDLYHPAREVRVQAARDLTEGLEHQLHILSHIFNTVAADKMIRDRLRRYPSWISKMNLKNELADQTVETLIAAVTGRYELVHRYYRLKGKLLGLERLYDYDRYAPVPGLSEQVISWPQCQAIVLESFREFSPRLSEIAGYFFDRNWIHAPVLAGKRGGAFAHPCVPEVHPYIMVNYTGNLRDVSTVAHELGHGMHQYLAAARGYYNSDTPLVLAETASVFAELLVFKAQVRLLGDGAARRAFVCQKLESIFATVFRQVAMNRFEQALHNARRTRGEMAPETLSQLWLETQHPMFGDSVTLTADYALWWSYIPHFLGTPGYVYSYAFGELLVLALYARYLEEGEAFVTKYLELLSAGGSDTPYRLLAPFGIDLDDPAFWHGGLKVIETMLAEVE